LAEEKLAAKKRKTGNTGAASAPKAVELADVYMQLHTVLILCALCLVAAKRSSGRRCSRADGRVRATLQAARLVDFVVAVRYRVTGNAGKARQPGDRRADNPDWIPAGAALTGMKRIQRMSQTFLHVTRAFTTVGAQVHFHVLFQLDRREAMLAIVAHD
jgi:hypothetical protein